MIDRDLAADLALPFADHLAELATTHDGPADMADLAELMVTHLVDEVIDPLREPPLSLEEAGELLAELTSLLRTRARGIEADLEAADRLGVKA